MFNKTFKTTKGVWDKDTGLLMEYNSGSVLSPFEAEMAQAKQEKSIVSEHWSDSEFKASLHYNIREYFWTLILFHIKDGRKDQIDFFKDIPTEGQIKTMKRNLRYAYELKKTKSTPKPPTQKLKKTKSRKKINASAILAIKTLKISGQAEVIIKYSKSGNYSSRGGGFILSPYTEKIGGQDKVTFYLESLEQLIISEQAIVKVKGFLCPKLKVNISEKAELKLDIVCEGLVIDASGSSNTFVKGKANLFNFNSTGSSEIEAPSLSAHMGHNFAEGMGEIIVKRPHHYTSRQLGMAKIKYI